MSQRRPSLNIDDLIERGLINIDKHESYNAKLITYNSEPTSIEINKLDNIATEAANIVSEFKTKEKLLKNICIQITQVENSIQEIDDMFNILSNTRKNLECEIAFLCLNDQGLDDLRKSGNNYMTKLLEHKGRLVYDKMEQLRILQDKKLVEEQNIENIRSFILLGVKQIIEIESIKTKIHICPICFNGEVEYCLEPCGHTLCTKCCKRLGTTCNMCRTVFDKKIKLFFSI